MKQKNRINTKHKKIGLGMALGAVVSALVALIVSSLTGDAAIWSWAIPVGVAVGLAVGAGWTRTGDEPEEKKSA